MSKRYQKNISGNYYSAGSVLFSFLFLLLGQSSLAQVKDSTITGIYTDFNSYWPTNTTNNSAVQPDTSHNLLAFTFRGNTYSTGVNDTILTTKIGTSYSKQVFKALPVNNIEGSVTSSSSTYIATAQKNDGNPNGFGYTSPYPVIHIADVLTDGKNGLDLGTGVTNLPVGANISFTIKNLSAKASIDTVPDLVFTQIADPSNNVSDVIYFYDSLGNVVGNKKSVNWNSVSKLGTYKLDLYKLSYESCNTSTINGSFTSTSTRDIRMVAFLLTEFGITNADSAAKVRGIKINPSGVSDQAFIAYNTKILNIDAPDITSQPAALQTFCTISTTSATFNVTATGTQLAYQWRKNGANITGATSSTYTATGLTLADTANNYTVRISNPGGAIISTIARIKYTIVTQPANQYVATGAPATFKIKASGATGFQWYKNGAAISGATLPSYTISSALLSSSGSKYSVVVTKADASTCPSDTALLTVENLPAITTQPTLQVLCNSASSTATYTVAGSSTSAINYQWYKNGAAISGATASSYSATGLTYTDTTSTYSVVLTNGVGSVTSSTAGLKYLILSSPAPINSYLATGNTLTFTASASSIATAFQWKKDGVAVSGANGLSYRINTVDTNSGGDYTILVSYAGGSCTSSAARLTTSIILYSKASGDINSPATWGVMPDGSGSSPVDFTRPEHTFIISNRVISTEATNLTIAGTYDLGDTVTTINPGTTLEAGRIIMTKDKGRIAGSITSGLIVHGKSELYFDPAKNILQTLTIATTDTVTLHNALNITAGSGHGTVKITQGVFNTGDSLLLKSDSLGTASVGNSQGTITGKVTIERFIPAHRAWRLFTSPVSDSLAPTIHDAWQEGAVNSTDNPHPGYGTHITYGNEADGFDTNPQHTFSLKVRNASGQWTGVPATNKTKVTDYPAYFFFIRGDRSYNITQTTAITTPKPTIIRTTGYLKQHTQPNTAVNNTGYTLVANPYASAVDFESVYQHSSVPRHMWMWNPNLAGDNGVGAYVLVYWNGNGYSTTPALPGANDMRFLQAYQGFFVESNGSNSAMGFTENDKDTGSLITAFGREVEGSTPRLEVNLNVFNSDNTTGVADGATYLFDNSFNNSVDRDDITKQLTNINENAGILSNGKLLAVEQRAMPVEKDSLQLSLTNTKSAAYQLDIIPNKMDNFSLYLYDRYLGTKTVLKATDTNRVKIVINTSVAASKAADRFVIISKAAAPAVVMFAHISATLQEEGIRVDWNVVNEANVLSYKVQRSADGVTFYDVASLPPSGKQSYSFVDTKPLKGMNYYRVQSMNRSGAPTFTGIVSEAFLKDMKSYIAVYPNPLTSNHCMIELHNKPAGKYDLTLTGNLGAVVFTTSVIITDGNSKQTLLLPASLAKGTYHLKIENNDTKETIKLVSLY